MATATKKRKVDTEGRRFQERWKLEYFFTEYKNNCVCLICSQSIAVFKECNVKRHYQTHHENTHGPDKYTGAERREELKRLEASLTSRQQLFTRARDSNENSTKASYEVATLIAKQCKPFTEGEFIKDCLMKAVDNICPDKRQAFANMCLARNTVARRIEELSADINRQVNDKGVKFDFFSIACDESTDRSDTAQLLIFLRGVDNDMNITEELLDLQSLKGQTRGVDLFDSLSSAVDGMKLPWSKVSAIVTDGAPAMAGGQSGLATRVCNKVTEEGGSAMKLHCIIHQQVLCAKCLPFDHVMKPVVKNINFIRSKALNHRQFQQFLLDMDAEYGDVLYHTDVRWLSRGNALQRFFSLRKEIGIFLADKGQPMEELSDPVWLSDFAFLVDITKHLNELNTNLQGKDAVVSQLYAHIKAFGNKLKLFDRHLSQTEPNTEHFHALREVQDNFPRENLGAKDMRKYAAAKDMRKYTAAIASLSEEFGGRFRDFYAMDKDMQLFSSPFSVDADTVPHQLQLELIELQCDDQQRGRQQHLSLVEFYRQLDKGKYPQTRLFAKRMLSLFGSTYLCEQTFSIMNLNKTRVRSRLTDAHLRDILRISTSALKPDLSCVMQARSQFHPSH